MESIQEKPALKINGFLILAGMLLLDAVGLWLSRNLIAIAANNDWQAIATSQFSGVILLAIALFLLFGFIPVQPN